MPPRDARWPCLLSAALGTLLWVGAAHVGGLREAWDGPEYWSVAYPLAVVAAALLGWAFPARPWRWALLLFVAQFFAMLLRNGELGSLWPIGLALFLGLALPAIVLAQLAAWLRSRFRPPRSGRE